MRRFLSLFTMLMLCGVFAFAQNRVVSGKVTDANGNAVPFATITVKGTKTGVSTDANGEFSLKVKDNAIVIVSSAGFVPKEVAVQGLNRVSVQLTGSTRIMDEVVVTAGGFKSKRKEVGTATSIIRAETLTAGKAVSVASGLQGKVAGLQISATGSGVNPSFRLILRGQRSLTGNNQALIVLDNIIVPNEILGNLNPEDIEDIVVLNGSGASALYGSKASNGALLVTTKKGKRGKTVVTVSQTEAFESVAFFPKIQTSFGSGGSAYGVDVNGQPVYNNQSNVENQSYGPRFDGTMKSIGYPLEDGSQDSSIYGFNNGHNKFWVTGVTSQTDVSLSTGDENSTFYLSGQYANVTGTTPGDKYNRTTLRANGTRKLGQRLMATYTVGYTQNRYDITTQTGTMYDNMLNMPSNIDITKYKNWKTDKFANPNGYYNPWYQNPYFTADNYRGLTRNDYLTGNVELKFTPIAGLDITGRQGISTRNFSSKSTVGKFTYSNYAKSSAAGGFKSDIAASVSDGTSYTTQLITDLNAQYIKRVKDFKFNLILGGQWTQNQAKNMNVGANGLVAPGLYNVSNGVGTPTATESNYLQREHGVYGDIRISFKDFISIHASGRNDWTSILAAENRSFFYPAIDGAIVVTDAIASLKSSKFLSYFKIRGGWSKVGQVNLGNSGDFGAYYLLPTFSSTASGFPYGTLAGYTVDNKLVSASLKPEITKGYEVGFDLNLFKDRFTSMVTYFDSKTDNQTVTTGVSTTTGFSGLLTNVGQTQSTGWEVTAHYKLIDKKNLTITVGGNGTILDNNVNSISADVSKLSLAASGSGASYAVAGQSFPVIMGFDYKRDPQGHVIVDAINGLPTKSDTISILGNASAKYKMGLDLSIAFKNIRLSMLFEYRGKYSVFQTMGGSMDWSGTGYRTAEYDRQRFVFPNSVIWDGAKYVPNTNVSIQNGNGNNGFWTDGINRDVTSNYVTSGDFWKMREIALAYEFPASLFTHSKFVKGFTFSMQARNLFVWMAKDNIYSDPEFSSAGNDSNGIGITGLQSPPSRYYGVTAKFTF